jgi:hypothetical protein
MKISDTISWRFRKENSVEDLKNDQTRLLKKSTLKNGFLLNEKDVKVVS